MSDKVNYDKSAPSAPFYCSMNPTANDISEVPQYGFQIPSQPAQQCPSYAGYLAPCDPPAYSQPGVQHYMPEHTPLPQTTQPTPPINQTVIVMGGCPSCRVGVLEEHYTLCGILCAICCFPIGILCCLAMKEKICTNCKATF